ncbi:MAG: pentapeptide repeat-containing protein, partial [Rivularia sp. (in: cyanobacteria)]
MPKNFFNQNLQDYSFKGEDLTGANFSNTNIQGADFSKAILRGANFTNCKAGIPNSWVIPAFGIVLLISAAIVLYMTYPLLDLGKPVNNRNEIREYINYSLGETLAFAVGEIAVFSGAVIGCVWKTKIDTRNQKSRLANFISSGIKLLLDIRLLPIWFTLILLVLDAKNI